MFIGAVLGPERRKETELGEGGFSAEEPDDPVIFQSREAVGPGQV